MSTIHSFRFSFYLLSTVHFSFKYYFENIFVATGIYSTFDEWTVYDLPFRTELNVINFGISYFINNYVLNFFRSKA